MSEHNDAHKDLVRRLRNPVGLVTENIIALNNEAASAIERLSERCEAYKGQVKAGSAETERLTASAPVDGDLQNADEDGERIIREVIAAFEPIFDGTAKEAAGDCMYHLHQSGLKIVRALPASAPVDVDEIVANAPEKLRALGARLADLLDADHWNNIEPLLLDIGRMFAALGEPCGHCHGSGDDQNHLNDPGPCHHCDGTGVVPAARTPEPDADVVERAAEAIYELCPNTELSGREISWRELSRTGETRTRCCEEAQAALAAANLLRTPAVQEIADAHAELDKLGIPRDDIVNVLTLADRIALADAELTAYRESAAGRPDREAVARIINPDAFDYEWLKDCRGNLAEKMRTLKEQNRAVAFEKADKIGALYPVARAVADADRFLNEECVSRWKKDGAQKAREELQLLAKALHCPDEKAAGVDEWQTFDTAPETGEEILCYRPDAGVFVALYRMPDEGDEPCWFATTGDDLTGDLPTHWMPMPSEPRPASKEASE